jgi:hypothetical protein
MPHYSYFTDVRYIYLIAGIAFRLSAPMLGKWSRELRLKADPALFRVNI